MSKPIPNFFLILFCILSSCPSPAELRVFVFTLVCSSLYRLCRISWKPGKKDGGFQILICPPERRQQQDCSLKRPTLFQTSIVRDFSSLAAFFSSPLVPIAALLRLQSSVASGWGICADITALTAGFGWRGDIFEQDFIDQTWLTLTGSVLQLEALQYHLNHFTRSSPSTPPQSQAVCTHFVKSWHGY